VSLIKVVVIGPEVVLNCTKGALTKVDCAGKKPLRSPDWIALESPVAVMEKLVAVKETPLSEPVAAPPARV
jgi:hypothetical protein